jgi:hypothetical protein
VVNEPLHQRATAPGWRSSYHQSRERPPTLKKKMLHTHFQLLITAGIFTCVCLPSGWAGSEPATKTKQAKIATVDGLSRGDYAKVIQHLETLRKRLEEWGSVSASAPIVMREHGQFGPRARNSR